MGIPDEIKEKLRRVEELVDDLYREAKKGVVDRHITSPDNVFAIVQLRDRYRDEYMINLGGRVMGSFRKLSFEEAKKICISYGGEFLMFPDGTRVSMDRFKQAIRVIAAMYDEEPREVERNLTFWYWKKNHPIGIKYGEYMAIIAPRVEAGDTDDTGDA